MRRVGQTRVPEVDRDGGSSGSATDGGDLRLVFKDQDQRSRVHALLANLPKLHYRQGAHRVGGLDKRLGNRIVAELGRFESPRVIETGVGATTLLFCLLNPAVVMSIERDGRVRDRTLREAAARDISLDRLRFIQERSEIALPRLAAEGERFDVGLIDGSHNWPAVFVDFCYINMMLRADGTLFVDDIHLHSVSELYLLLCEQEQFECVALDDKLATFRKLDESRFLPEWRRQPYIARNTPVEQRDPAYEALARRVEAAVHEHVPKGSTVLVVSKGDDALVGLDGREGWHFPQLEDGTWSGQHPADDEHAIAQLERLRERGAEYFVVPATSLWWLDHYSGFRRHLERYRCSSADPDTAMIYELEPVESYAGVGDPA
jgi:hypothetical protein